MKILAPLLFVVGLIFVISLSGLLVGIGLGAPLVIIAIAGIGLFGFIAAYGIQPFKDGGTGFFWWALLCALITNWLDLFSPLPLSSLADLGLLAATPFMVSTSFRAVRATVTGYIVVFLFLISFTLGVVSSYFSPFSSVTASVYQLAYNAKWPLMLLLGFRVGWEPEMERKLIIVMVVFFAVATSFLVFQNVSPNIYYVFGRNLTEARNPNPLTGGLLYRGTGPFIHSSVLAFFSAVFVCFSWVIAIQAPKALRFRYFLLTAAMFALLIFSGQKQEASAALVTIGLVTMALRIRYPLPAFILAITATAVLMVGLFGLLGREVIDGLGEEWGLLSSFDSLKSARPVMVEDSISLANQYFPLGTGLGTFAGIGAKLFNRDLYSSLGYSVHWWYVRDIFLLDTYWPNFIAELGWLGFICLFLIPMILVFHSWYKVVVTTKLDHKKIWAFAFVGQLVPFIISMTSPIYSDPQMVGFTMMLYGIAAMYGQIGKFTANDLVQIDRRDSVKAVGVGRRYAAGTSR